MQIQHTHRGHDQTRSTRSPWTRKKRKEEEHFLNASCLLACLPATFGFTTRGGKGEEPPTRPFLRWSCPRRWQIRSRMTLFWNTRWPLQAGCPGFWRADAEKSPFPEIFQLGHTDCPGTPVRYDRAECVPLTFLLTYYQRRRFAPVWISTYAGGTFSFLSPAQAFFPFFFCFWRHFAKKWNNKIKFSKMKWIWSVSVARTENKIARFLYLVLGLCSHKHRRICS